MSHYPRPKPEYLVKHLNEKRYARLAKRREAYRAKKAAESQKMKGPNQ